MTPRAMSSCSSKRFAAGHVEAPCPEMLAGFGFGQLRRHPQQLSGRADASVHDVADPEITSHRADIHGTGLVGEGRRARDDEKPRNARQEGNHILGQAVDQKVQVPVAGQVRKRQDGNGRAIAHQRRRFGRRRSDGTGRRDSIEPDGRRNVLQLPLAHVLEDQVQLAFHLLVRGTGNPDTARIGLPLDARSQVHAVAEDVFVVDDDVTDIDAGTKVESPIGSNAFVALGHGALDVDRAPNRFDDAREFQQHAVAGALDDAPFVFGDLGVDEVPPVGFQRGQGAALVAAHQARVSNHVE